jgi:hypothetical protein
LVEFEEFDFIAQEGGVGNAVEGVVEVSDFVIEEEESPPG